MALQTPNLDRISKENPKLGEALLKEQQYINQNVTQQPGNKKSPPTGFVNPGSPSH